MAFEQQVARDVVRVINKHVLNPVTLILAGRKHFYASVIRHTGRRSGKTYRTPVMAHRVGDGFLIPLPYGTRVDWLRNIEAGGRTDIHVRGDIFTIEHPTIADTASALSEFPALRRLVFASFGIDRFVHVDIADRADDVSSRLISDRLDTTLEPPTRVHL